MCHARHAPKRIISTWGSRTRRRLSPLKGGSRLLRFPVTRSPSSTVPPHGRDEVGVCSVFPTEKASPAGGREWPPGCYTTETTQLREGNRRDMRNPTASNYRNNITIEPALKVRSGPNSLITLRWLSALGPGSSSDDVRGSGTYPPLLFWRALSSFFTVSLQQQPEQPR